MINTIIFDIGGVLQVVPNEKIKAQIAADKNLSKQLVDEVWAELISNYLGRGKITTGEFLERFTEQLECPEEITSDYLNGLIERYYKEIPGTLKIVKKLKEKNYKLGILSDNSKPFVDYPKKQKLFDLFDDLIFSYEVGYRKSEPEIFKIALERLGSRTEESVFIDDVEEYVIAAKELGMYGIVFKNADQLANELFELGIKFSLYEFDEDTHIGANALLVDNQGNLILQQRDNDPRIINPGTISMFGGTIKKDEKPLEGLIREVKENIGIDISKKIKELNIYKKTKEKDGIDYTTCAYIVKGMENENLNVTEGTAVVKNAEEFLKSDGLTRITQLAVKDYMNM